MRIGILEHRNGTLPRQVLDLPNPSGFTPEHLLGFLGSAGEVPCLRVDFHPVAFLDEERNADLDARLEHGDLGGTAGVSVAFVAHPGGRHGQLDLRRQLERDRVPVELLE